MERYGKRRASFISQNPIALDASEVLFHSLPFEVSLGTLLSALDLQNLGKTAALSPERYGPFSELIW